MDAGSVILIDAPEDSPIDVSFLESLGHTVIMCHGPPHGTLCPILAGDECPKAGAAHGVIFQLDLDRPQHRAILAKYQEVLPDEVPIRVATTAASAHRHAALLAGVQVWIHEPAVGDLDGFAALVETVDRLREVEIAG
jgi:hypothetical protein